MNPAMVPPSAPPPPLPRSMPITRFVVKYNPYPMWNPFARKPLANPPRNISPLAIHPGLGSNVLDRAWINSSFLIGIERSHVVSTHLRLLLSFSPSSEGYGA